MTDSEILRSVGLGTLLDNVSNNLIGRRVLRAMAQARIDEREVCAALASDVAAGRDADAIAEAILMRSNASN